MTATILPLYTREGSCEPQRCAAACCRAIFLEVNPVYLHDADVAAWVRLHGIELAEREGRVLARINAPCSVLGQAGTCLIYDRPERPKLCADFPQAPAALFGIEGACSYRFTTEGR